MRAGTGFTLLILNEDTNDIIKIKKSLEDLDVIYDGVTEQWNIQWSFASIVNQFNSATSNFFSSKGISGRGVSRAWRGIMHKHF